MEVTIFTCKSAKGKGFSLVKLKAYEISSIVSSLLFRKNFASFRYCGQVPNSPFLLSVLFT